MKMSRKSLMRCFSNAPATIQAIEKLRGIKQRPGENVRLYATRYEVIHFRANQLMAEEQNQSGEMMFYVGTLQDHLRRKLLKRIHSTYRPPRNLWEAFYLALDFQKEYKNKKIIHNFSVVFTLLCHLPPLGAPPVRVIT